MIDLIIFASAFYFNKPTTTHTALLDLKSLNALF